MPMAGPATAAPGWSRRPRGRPSCQDPCTMDFTEIRYEAADGVLTITLNRPDRLNAFTPTMMSELIAAFDAADEDDDVRAVIVTGEGRGFCAGADLERGGETFDWRARGNGGEGGGENPRDGGGGGSPRLFLGS